MSEGEQYDLVESRERKAWLTAIICSTVLNVLLLWLLSASQNVQARKKEVSEAKIINIDLTMEQIKKEPIKSKPLPEMQTSGSKKRFVETEPTQESSSAPVHTKNEGERNTRAASDALPVAEAPRRASVEGAEKRTPSEIELANQELKEGEAEQLPTTTAVDPPKPSGIEKEKLLSDPLAREQKKVLTKKKESTAKKSLAEKVTEEGKAQKSEREKRDEKLKTEFSAPKEKKRMLGSVSRKGEAAMDVADSPLGRYKASLSKAVSREWLRNCLRYRDHIAPGAFYITFQVDENGLVSSISINEEQGDASEMRIQKGFTLKSLKDARIPPMPKAVDKELGGDPLEVMYIFYF